MKYMPDTETRILILLFILSISIIAGTARFEREKAGKIKQTTAIIECSDLTPSGINKLQAMGINKSPGEALKDSDISLTIDKASQTKN